MYYFFGAGNNCPGALKFWGVEEVIAIVDNSSAKVGKELLGVPVISFTDFLKRYQDEMVIITAYLAGQKVALQLEAVGISNYFICPYMQSGFYSSEKMIKEFDLYKHNVINLYDDNPIADKLMQVITKQNPQCQVNIISDDDLLTNQVNVSEPLVVVKEQIQGEIQQLISKYNMIIDIYYEMDKRKGQDYSHLEKFHNLHQGEKCFLIGNGPSLKASDLELLHNKGIICFGCNQIFKIYEKTDWRPNYHVIGDSLVYESNKNKFCSKQIYFFRNFEIEKNENIYVYSAKGEKYESGYPTFSDDLICGVYGGRTVMYDMLQIAVYMGFEEIYLLGVDFSWSLDGKNTHFCQDYMDSELAKEISQHQEEQLHAYISAQKYAECHGVKIFNATRGGKLEVFERVNIDEIL